MCGITGIFNSKSLPEQMQDRDTFLRMITVLNNRGPDEMGAFFSNYSFLGHHRLSIVDPETGQQPMLSDDERYCIVFNGEIFNHIELRNMLSENGVKFRTKSDTEVLLHLYKKYKYDLLNYLNGQYAFAILDLYEKTLFIARDQVGIIPLYYTTIGETLFFASSIKSLLANSLISNEVNLQALEQIASFWTTIGDNTFLKDIKSLPSGYYLISNNQGISKKRYWDMEFEETDLSYSEEKWCEKINIALSDAVDIRLRADVPVNVYLSGGLDSSILTYQAKSLYPEKFTTYSVNFDEGEYDECKYQRILSDALSVSNKAQRTNSDDISSVFKDVIFHAEQPIYRTAPAPLFHLSKMVRDDGFKVVLTGEGADELAWGYDIFKEAKIRSALIGNKDSSRWASELVRLYPYLKQFNKRYSLLMADFYMSMQSDIKDPLFSHRIRIENGKRLRRFYTDFLKIELDSNPSAEEILQNTLPDDFDSLSLCQKTQYIEMKTLLSGYLLSSQGDRMLMSHSIEGRFPFLDKNVIELFSKIPEDLKLKKMDEKYILKKAFSKVLPNEITSRTKYPYRAPEAQPLMNSVIREEFLNQDSLIENGLFDAEVTAMLAERLKAGSHNFNENMIMVIILSTQIFISLCKNRFHTNDIQLKTNIPTTIIEKYE